MQSAKERILEQQRKAVDHQIIKMWKLVEKNVNEDIEKVQQEQYRTRNDLEVRAD